MFPDRTSPIFTSRLAEVDPQDAQAHLDEAFRDTHTCRDMLQFRYIMTDRQRRDLCVTYTMMKEKLTVCWSWKDTSKKWSLCALDGTLKGGSFSLRKLFCVYICCPIHLQETNTCTSTNIILYCAQYMTNIHHNIVYFISLYAILYNKI